jgi:hypothetical protein
MNMAMPQPTTKEPIRLVQPAEAPVAGPLAGDPGMLGLPSFIAGSVALGLAAIGLLPGATTNAALPILLAAASAGLILATVWSAVTGQNAAAGIYGIFGGFYLSYALLMLGLIHNWFGIGLTQIVGTQKMFLITWIVIVTMLVLATLRLPVIFTALFTLVDVTLLLNLLAVIQVPASTNLVKAAGWVIMAFSAIGVYLFFGAAWHATGGKVLPTGKAILHT